MGSGFSLVGVEGGGGTPSGGSAATAGGVLGGFTERGERGSQIRNVSNQT